MKKILFLMIAFSIGCTSSKSTGSPKGGKTNSIHKKVKVSYKYEMVSPKLSSLLFFEDSSISASFIISSNEIDFTLKNKLNDPIKLIWDEASMVVIGSSEKVMHKGVKYIDRNSSMPASTILPNSNLDDLVVPTGNIYYKEGYYGTYYSSAGGWQTKPLLLSTLNLPKDSSLIGPLNNQVITLYLPISDMQNKRIGYTFKFKVSEVIIK